MYHTSRLVSTAGALDAMTTQRDVIYTAKAETRVKVHKRDKASVGHHSGAPCGGGRSSHQGDLLTSTGRCSTVLQTPADSQGPHGVCVQGQIHVEAICMSSTHT